MLCGTASNLLAVFIAVPACYFHSILGHLLGHPGCSATMIELLTGQDDVGSNLERMSGRFYFKRARGTSVNLNMEFRLEFLGFSRGNFLFPHYRRTDPLSVSLVYAVRTLPLITARLSLFFLHRLGSLFWSKYATQLFVVCLTHILCLQVHCALRLEVDGT